MKIATVVFLNFLSISLGQETGSNRGKHPSYNKPTYGLAWMGGNHYVNGGHYVTQNEIAQDQDKRILQFGTPIIPSENHSPSVGLNNIQGHPYFLPSGTYFNQGGGHSLPIDSHGSQAGTHFSQSVPQVTQGIPHVTQNSIHISPGQSYATQSGAQYSQIASQYYNNHGKPTLSQGGLYGTQTATHSVSNPTQYGSYMTQSGPQVQRQMYQNNNGIESDFQYTNEEPKVAHFPEEIPSESQFYVPPYVHLGGIYSHHGGPHATHGKPIFSPIFGFHFPNIVPQFIQGGNTPEDENHLNVPHAPQDGTSPTEYETESTEDDQLTSQNELDGIYNKPYFLDEESHPDYITPPAEN